MNIRKIIGNNIRDCRAFRGYSQRRLSELADLNSVYISSVERGERNITVENLVVIATALRIPVHLLLVKDAFSFKASD
ncbi:MAG TPA: helix-turn-helix transcriptional regulator [Candidatus Kapabacteria bacterium]|nr:helix-turn-helix transcriptional regulator [Candidatus Kapabacteria bacterium]